MAAGPWLPTNTTASKILNGQFDLNSDTMKMALFLSTSNIGATSTTYAGLTNEHANGNGYTTGGEALTPSVNVVNTDEANFDVADVVWTASGGSIVARFAVIYEVGGDVICYCLLDSAPADVTATAGNTFTIQISSSGVFTLAPA